MLVGASTVQSCTGPMLQGFGMVEELIEALAFMEQHGFETLAAPPPYFRLTTTWWSSRQRRRPSRPPSSPTRTPSGARAMCGTRPQRSPRTVARPSSVPDLGLEEDYSITDYIGGRCDLSDPHDAGPPDQVYGCAPRSHRQRRLDH